MLVKTTRVAHGPVPGGHPSIGTVRGRTHGCRWRPLEAHACPGSRDRKPKPAVAAKSAWPSTAARATLKASVVGASGHNLKHVSVDFPVGLLTCVTGVSGSGKSTGERHALRRRGAPDLPRARRTGRARNHRGHRYFDKVINVDQSPIGARRAATRPRTPDSVHADPRADGRSERRARSAATAPGRLSFNVAGALRGLRGATAW